MARIHDVLERQADELVRTEVSEARPLLQAVTTAAQELSNDLDTLEAQGMGETFTAQHLRVMLAQNDQAMYRLRWAASTSLNAQIAAVHAMAAKHAIDVITRMEPSFEDAGGVMEVAVMRRLAELDGLQIHRYALDRYTTEVADAIQRELVAGFAKGSTYRELRKRLTGAALVPSEARGALVVRMESNAAYNRAHQATLEETAAVTDWADTSDPLMKQADESIDRRNHPLSRAVNGMVVAIDEPWRVPKSLVLAALKQIEATRKPTKSGKKRKPMKLSGILWPLVGSNYVGTYPAHYNERGRQVPFRSSWGF